MLGERLLAEGWAVRGTSREEAGLEAIREAGIEPALADPHRPGTVLELVGDVAVVYWLLGSARGGEAEVGRIHGERLEALLERLVDTPVRCFVYEAAGTVEAEALHRGGEAVRAAAERWRIPAETVAVSPDDPEGWARAMLEAGGLERTSDEPTQWA